MQLILGNQNYSSWSMRAGLTVRAFDLPVEIKILWLDGPDASAQKLAISPAGKVPILQDGELTIWDSLAISEYLAEQFPTTPLWPTDRTARAKARCLCAEMHAGFPGLREHMPMNLRSVKPARTWPGEMQLEIERATAIFASAEGPFLFGAFSLADVFYTPIACRFQTYGIGLSGPAKTYSDAILQHPAVQTWFAEARAEGHAITKYD